MTPDTEILMRGYIQGIARCCSTCFRQRTAACVSCPASGAKALLERVADMKAREIPTRTHGKRMRGRIVSILTQLHTPSVKSGDITAPGCTAKMKAKTFATMISDGLIEAQASETSRKLYTITPKGIKYVTLHGTATA